MIETTMHIMADAFDRAFRARAPQLEILAENSADSGVLHDIFVRCSPLGALLPAVMLEHQAVVQQTGERARYPAAMRRIVRANCVPIGRIVIDWTDGHSHCVDVAVLPAARGGAVGLHLLRAWLDVADAQGLTAGLMVLHDNPAVRLYRRLGFGVVDDREVDTPCLTMRRAPRVRQPAASRWIPSSNPRSSASPRSLPIAE